MLQKFSGTIDEFLLKLWGNIFLRNLKKITRAETGIQIRDGIFPHESSVTKPFVIHGQLSYISFNKNPDI